MFIEVLLKSKCDDWRKRLQFNRRSCDVRVRFFIFRPLKDTAKFIVPLARLNLSTFWANNYCLVINNQNRNCLFIFKQITSHHSSNGFENLERRKNDESSIGGFDVFSRVGFVRNVSDGAV
jgi:hypothetical protein